MYLKVNCTGCQGFCTKRDWYMGRKCCKHCDCELTNVERLAKLEAMLKAYRPNDFVLPPKRTVAEVVRVVIALRVKGLTQTEIANATGYNQGSISKMLAPFDLPKFEKQPGGPKNSPERAFWTFGGTEGANGTD